MNSKQTVIVVDDDEGVRDSLSMLLESVGLGFKMYSNAAEALNDLHELTRGCFLLDIRMPGMSGLELQAELRKRGSRLPIIFITGHGDIGLAVKAMRQGALDFIAKPYHEQDLLDRIHEALEHEESAYDSVQNREAIRNRIATLSKREREVFERVADGQANKAIAYELNVSERTVEVHRSQVMKKMRARTLPHLVRMRITADATSNDTA